MKFLLSLILVLNPSVSLAQAVPGKISDATIAVGTNGPTNYVKNPSAILNVQGITLSSATGTRDTDTADKLDGKASWLCDSSSQNGYCEFDTNTIQEGDKTGNCEAKALFKGDASLYKLQVTDGSSVLASSSVLPNVTDWTPVSVNYPCGSTREVRLTQTEAGTGAAVNIGRVYWGQATNLGVMNANADCRTVTMTSSWVSNTTVTAVECRQSDRAFYRVKAAVAGGAPTAATLTFTLPTGRVIDTAKLIGTAVAISPLGEGRANDSGANIYGVGVAYSNTTTVTLRSAGSAGSAVDFNTAITNTNPFSFNDGDSVEIDFEVPIVGWGSQTVASSSQQLLPTIQKFTSGSGTYTLPAGVVSIKVKAIGGGGGGGSSGTASWGAATAGGNTTFGTAMISAGGGGIGQQAATGGTGGTGSLGTGPIGSVYTGGKGQGSGILGSAPTNATPSIMGAQGGSSCVGGAGSGGHNTAAGTDGQANTGGGGGGGAAGNTVANNYFGSGGGAGACVEAIINNPSSTYAYAVGAGGNGGAAGTNGVAGGAGGSGYIEVTEYYSNATPLLVGSVTSNSSGLERSERLRANCSSSAAITDQSGSWVSSIGNVASGACAITLAGGIFSSTPTCVGNQADVNGNILSFIASSATAVSVDCRTDAGGDCSTYNFTMQCQGPR